MNHPYSLLPPRNFWRSAVATVDPLQMQDVYRKRFDISPDSFVATAGSCFAQHLTQRLRRHFKFLDMEPPPPALPRSLHEKFGYGLYSARYGNIYSPAHLRQLASEAIGRFVPLDDVWECNGRYYDPYRPSIEPNGFGSAEEVRALRAGHLKSVRALLHKCDVFVFTLGVTETWRSILDGAVYQICPGTNAGTFDPDRHVFHNCGFTELYEDMLGFISIARALNASMKFLLTVSPVPLTATATNQHVLSASSYSKSVLRTVCGELFANLDYVDYFPSYEMILSPAAKGRFFDDNLRTIRQDGVDFVVSSLFHEHPGRAASNTESGTTDPIEEVCDEEELNRLRVQS